MKNIVPFLLAAVVLMSCEKTVVLDLNQSTPRVVIEGLVTNQPGLQYVKVTRSGGFYDTGEAPRVNNAAVTITDSDGQVITFLHNPHNKPDSAGYYVPASTFVGQIGKSYHLTVGLDGQTYDAEDLMAPVTAIDSLTFQVNEDEEEDPKDFGKFYEVLIYAKEPQNTTDYYLFKFYRNDSLKVYNDTDIYYSDDETLGENIDGVESPIYYAPGDKARLEMYSLTRPAYVFYNDLQRLLTSDGGLFSQPPANSRTNVSNGALGFFQVSAMTSSAIVINP